MDMREIFVRAEFTHVIVLPVRIMELVKILKAISSAFVKNNTTEILAKAEWMYAKVDHAKIMENVSAIYQKKNSSAAVKRDLKEKPARKKVVRPQKKVIVACFHLSTEGKSMIRVRLLPRLNHGVR